MKAEALAGRLDEAAKSANYEFQLRDALYSLRDEGALEADRAECLAQMFGYGLSTRDQTDQREANGGPFVPMYAFNDGTQWPPPASLISDECLRDAASVVESATDPLVVARLSDVLWERRFGSQAYRHAERAVAAYLDCPKRPPLEHGDILSVQAAERALEIATQLNHAGLRIASRDRLLSIAEGSLESDDPGLGVIGGAVGAVLTLPKSEIPPGLDDLLVRAMRVFREDPWARETIYELRIQLARDAPKVRRRLEDQQVEDLIKAANAAPHVFLKHAFLERAQTLLYARNSSAEELQRVARLVEESPVRREDFSAIRSDFELSAVELDELLRPSIALPSWEAALTWYRLQGPPTGDPEESMKAALRQSEEAPVQFMLPKMLHGPGGIPLRRFETEEERLEYAIAMNHRLATQVAGELYMRALRMIVGREDFPGLDALRIFCLSPACTEAVADAVARSLLHFRDGNFDEAVHVLVPRVETMIRALAHEIGVATSRLPDTGGLGGYVSLRVLFDRLQPVGLPDDAWLRYGRFLLIEAAGENLRNEIAHGLRPVVTAREAALAIHFALHVCSLRARSVEGPEGH